MKRLNDMFEDKIKDLSDKEQIFFRNLKNKSFTIYETIKPILIAIGLFWIFTRIKHAIGLQEAFYVQGIVIIILLRMIASRLA
jgi:hypothetical protein